MNFVRRALGSVPDAAWFRRQFTRDADAVHDVVHGVRLLLRTPGPTTIALFVFALGIGAATAIVSVADAFFMRALPVPQADRVVTIWQYNRETGAHREFVAPGNAIDWMARVRSFETISMAEGFSVSSGREPGYVTAARVGERFFQVIGTPMLLGRAFLPHEHQKGAGRFAILGYPLWRDRFGSDTTIVGKAVRFSETETFTVVGVMRPDLELRLYDTRSAQAEPLLWIPKQGVEPFEPTFRTRGSWTVVGRLAPGVSIDEAQAELDALSAQLARDFPQTNKQIAAEIVPLRTHLVGSLHDVLPLLLGAAAVLLLVACANVANLLLARGIGRAREFAVRQALGAGRGRLVRQMLVESLLLAMAGGVTGLFLARWTLDAIARLRPLDVARVDQIPIDARAAAIACGVTLLAAIAAGLAPALQLSRPAASTALKEGRASARRGVRGALVVLEVAAALVLAVCAGLLVRSFVLIQGVDPGFSRDHVSVIQVFASPRIETPAKRIVFFQQAVDRMRALPGVVAVGGVSAMPFGLAKVVIRSPLAIVGRPAAAGDAALVQATAVAGDYFRTMGVPLVQGRVFDATDGATSRQVAIVSRAAVQQFWQGANPLGSRVRFQYAGAPYDAEVIGVVGDVRQQALDGPASAELFLPYAQSGFRALSLVVRTAPGSPATLDVLKAQIWALDPQQAIYHTTTMDDLVSRTLVGRRFSLFVLGGFAFVTLLLATAGVYGVMSFTIGQRTREFGVRVALGAARRDIVGLVLREGLTLAGAGVIAGTVVALGFTRLLRALLFGVTATDPVTFLSVSLALVLVAAAACYVPATRALRIDPSKALRLD